MLKSTIETQDKGRRIYTYSGDIYRHGEASTICLKQNKPEAKKKIGSGTVSEPNYHPCDTARITPNVAPPIRSATQLTENPRIEVPILEGRSDTRIILPIRVEHVRIILVRR